MSQPINIEMMSLQPREQTQHPVQLNNSRDTEFKVAACVLVVIAVIALIALICHCPVVGGIICLGFVLMLLGIKYKMAEQKESPALKELRKVNHAVTHTHKNRREKVNFEQLGPVDFNMVTTARPD